jgi:hypothetical protein
VFGMIIPPARCCLSTLASLDAGRSHISLPVANPQHGACMIFGICSPSPSIQHLRPRLLLLLLPQRTQTDTRHLNDLEPHTWNITLGLALSSETRQQHLVILVHEVQATIIRHYISISIPFPNPSHISPLTESSDLLPVLDQLHTHAFSDGAVGLFGFDTDFLEDDAFGVGGAAEGGGLVGGAEEALLVVQVGPAAVFALL